MIYLPQIGSSCYEEFSILKNSPENVFAVHKLFDMTDKKLESPLRENSEFGESFVVAFEKKNTCVFSPYGSETISFVNKFSEIGTSKLKIHISEKSEKITFYFFNENEYLDIER